MAVRATESDSSDMLMGRCWHVKQLLQGVCKYTAHVQHYKYTQTYAKVVWTEVGSVSDQLSMHINYQ